jgi:UDP-N-acetylmuramate dehydrogenase
VQNSGAYGVEIKDMLLELDAVEIATGEVRTIGNADCVYAYRQSRFKKDWKNKYLITSVTYLLKKTFAPRLDYGNIREELWRRGYADPTPQQLRDTIIAIREAKLPDPEEIASSGSFFKNVYLTNPADIKTAEAKGIPVWDGGKIPSGWLIENAGLRGKDFHGMRVSDKASLVLINESAKNYADLAAAREEIIKQVRDKFGYTLEQEPMELGE